MATNSIELKTNFTDAWMGFLESKKEAYDKNDLTEEDKEELKILDLCLIILNEYLTFLHKYSD